MSNHQGCYVDKKTYLRVCELLYEGPDQKCVYTGDARQKLQLIKHANDGHKDHMIKKFGPNQWSGSVDHSVETNALMDKIESARAVGTSNVVYMQHGGFRNQQAAYVPQNHNGSLGGMSSFQPTFNLGGPKPNFPFTSGARTAADLHAMGYY